MGYNTWNDLGCEALHEVPLREIAAKLKRLGLLSLGYRYFNVDDCWMRWPRNNETSRLDAEPMIFPSGMRAFGDHIRALGFKFGLYTSRGYGTCVGRPASLGYEAIDAQDFARWGVDFLKNDGCNDPDCSRKFDHPWTGTGVCDLEGRRKTLAKYDAMRRSLNGTGRPIVHAICGWQPWYAVVGRRFGHMWRISADVRDWLGIYEATRIMEQLVEFHGPNGWNDPDMLLGSSVGSSLTVTPTQARAQFSLWVVMAAPLIIGASVLNMSQYDLETYSNAEAIRINQDPLGMPGRVVFSNCPAYPRLQTWLSADGTPEFEIDTAGTMDGVTCGDGLRAPNCAGCRRWDRQTLDWCGGDCEWVKLETSSGHPERVCTYRGLPGPLTEEILEPPSEDSPDSFARYRYRQPDMHQCQQVWAKPLQGGEVALAAVNFASDWAEVRLPLAALAVPWQTYRAKVRDLWQKGGGEPAAEVKDELRVPLAPAGGHALLRLVPRRAQAGARPPAPRRFGHGGDAEAAQGDLLAAAIPEVDPATGDRPLDLPVALEQPEDATGEVSILSGVLCLALCALLALFLARHRQCVAVRAKQGPGV